MKVILLKDVARIGRRFEVKDVPDGHALNMLIPKGLVQPATPENMKRLNERVGKKEASGATQKETFEATLEALKTASVTMSVSASEQGHLFKSIKATDIAALVSKEIGPLTADQVSLHTPIKSVGSHEITVAFGDRKGTFTLVVTAQ